MNILAVNCGSGSVTLAFVHCETEETIVTLRAEKRGRVSGFVSVNGMEVEQLEQFDYETAIRKLFYLFSKHSHEELKEQKLDAVVHRVVHAGPSFLGTHYVTDSLIKNIEKHSRLAPLHNPIILKGIRIAGESLSSVPHIAVLDNGFHQTLPRSASTYPIPKALRDKHRFQRYGFHGISHEYVARKAADFLKRDLRLLRIITCHLSGGCSVSAVEYGRSVETSMGCTPLEGLPMATRCGDLDPGLLLALLEQFNPSELSDVLRTQSGIRGLSCGYADMAKIEEQARNGNDDCRLAIEVFTHRVRKYIGAYAAVMGGVDAIVFTGNIGVESSRIRHNATQRLQFLGALLDETRNRTLQLTKKLSIAEFSASNSQVMLLAVRSDEELAMTFKAQKLLDEKACKASSKLRVPIAASVRHVHLRKETIEQLFGEGVKLTQEKELSQPGQFLADQTVTLVGPEDSIKEVSIVGPPREDDQVEISQTDEFTLGVDAPIRASGEIGHTPGIILCGPEGKVTLSQGVICPLRHIHMSPEDAKRFHVNDGQTVQVEVISSERGLVFRDVLIRVSPNYRLEMHVDTDEANAAGISDGGEGRILAQF